MLKAALPASRDGFALQMPWQSTTTTAPSASSPRCGVEQAGFEMIWAGYYRAGGETGLDTTLYTDELFFFEEGNAVAEAQHALLTAAG